MLLAAFLAFAVLALVALLISPKLGAILVWPIILVYPHLYMGQLNLLPWNIGVDDLFICVFFLVVVVQRNLFGHTELRLGLTVLGAAAYLLVWTVAQFSGWVIMPELLPVDILKPILKDVIFVLFAYALVHTIDTERDLKRIAYAFVLFMTLAAIIVILHKLLPSQFAIFTAERFERLRRAQGEVQRAVGPFLSPNTGAALLGMAVIFALQARSQVGIWGRMSLLVVIPTLLIAMVLTGSRSGGLALAATLVVMAVVSRSRFYAAGLLGLCLLAVVVRPSVVVEYWERLRMVYNPEAGGMMGGAGASRVWAWKQYWSTATPQIWLFGQGMLVPTQRIGLNAHSTYVAALFYHGVGGAVWFLVFFGIIVRRAIWLSRLRMEPYRSLASAVLWGLLVWAIAGLAADLLTSLTPHYVYLFYAVLIERSYKLANATTTMTILQPARVPPQPAPAARLVT